MNAVGIGILYLVLGNMVAVFSDVLVKVLEPDQPIFQFVFFRQVSAALLLMPWLLWSWRRNPPVAIKWHLLRAHIWAVGVCLMVVALTRLPLATANALFYAAPLMMVPLAVWLAGEAISRQKVLTAVIGFIGVLIVLRPTEVNWAALGGARGGAVDGGQQPADQTDPSQTAHRPDPVFHQRAEHALHSRAGLVGRGRLAVADVVARLRLLGADHGLCGTVRGGLSQGGGEQDRLGGIYRSADGGGHRGMVV